MAARHKRSKKASGGEVKRAGGNPFVFADAEAKKSGGKAIGAMHGGKSKGRLDRPGRKTGGRVGADKSPLSTAHRTSSATAATD